MSVSTRCCPVNVVDIVDLNTHKSCYCELQVFSKCCQLQTTTV